VRFFAPFDDFSISSPLPAAGDAYLRYRLLATEFIAARNQRIVKCIAP
jgi:hypothetical protein